LYDILIIGGNMQEFTAATRVLNNFGMIREENAREYDKALAQNRPVCIEAATDIDHLTLMDFPYIGMDCPEGMEEVTVWSFQSDDPAGMLERFRAVLRSQFKKTPWYCYAQVYRPDMQGLLIGVFQVVPDENRLTPAVVGKALQTIEAAALQRR